MTVLLLDDNMPLRSMRHEYYQLARKCKLMQVIHSILIISVVRFRDVFGPLTFIRAPR